jgi:hypothetical protein
VLGCAAALLAAGSAAPRPLANSGEVSDPAGDSGPAPDLTTIALSNDDNGIVTWRISFGNRPLFFRPDFLQIFLDADLQSGTGPEGFELMIQVAFPLASGLFRWNGSAYDRVDAGFEAATGSGEISFSIDFRQLGSQSLRFYIYADTEPATSDDLWDEAPNAPGVLLYAVQVPLVLDSFTPPKVVRAGQKLSVAVGVWTNDELLPKTSCRARIGRKAVTGKPAWASILVPSPLPDWAALSRKGVASCRFAVSRKARGKTINVTMAMTKEGVTLREVFSQKIR